MKAPYLVALSGQSLRRTLRVQVVAEGLAHSLVTWSTLALDVFPAWSLPLESRLVLDLKEERS